MKKVLTVGVYDILHIGHVVLFERAKKLGDYLIVAVQDDDYIQKYKPNVKMVYSIEEREYMVRSIRFVDEVVTYQDVDKLLSTISFDVFVKGPDQNHAGFQKAVQWCIENRKEVIILPRTDGVSSTSLREYLSDK